MKSAQKSSKRGAVSPALIILVLVLGGAGSFGTLWWMGDVSIPFLDGLRGDSASQDRTGKVAVPIAARDVIAYTMVRRDDLWDPETQEFASVWLDADVVEERGIMRGNEVLNRVLAVDKKKGYAFSEDDFLPLGTREGPAAGIEPGMRGLRVNADSIRGLHGLRRGDRFDLIATQKMESGKKGRRDDVSPLARAAHQEDEAWEVSTRIIVQNGKLVEPVGARASIAPNGTQLRRVEEAFLGIAEEEVTRLTEALAVDAEILCVPRSALPGAGGNDLMAHARPDGPGVVEVYSNGKRSLTYVPRGPDYEAQYAEDEFLLEEVIAAVEPEIAEDEVVVEVVAMTEDEVSEEPVLVEEVVEEEPVEPLLATPEPAVEEAVFEEVTEPQVVEAAAVLVEDEPGLPDYGDITPHEDELVEDCSEELEVAALTPDPEERLHDPLPYNVSREELAELSVMDAIVARERGLNALEEELPVVEEPANAEELEPPVESSEVEPVVAADAASEPEAAPDRIVEVEDEFHPSPEPKFDFVEESASEVPGLDEASKPSPSELVPAADTPQVTEAGEAPPQLVESKPAAETNSTGEAPESASVNEADPKPAAEEKPAGDVPEPKPAPVEAEDEESEPVPEVGEGKFDNVD